MCDFIQAKMGRNSSFAWHSIMAAQARVRKGLGGRLAMERAFGLGMTDGFRHPQHIRWSRLLLWN